MTLLKLSINLRLLNLLFQLPFQPTWGLPTTSPTIQKNILDKAAAGFLHRMMNLQFIDGIKNHLDFLGLNYYGEERIVNSSVPPQDDLEYSESGRAINPNGFYKLLVDFHQRYNVKRNKNIPFIITENGISDSTDKIRPLYLVEHLKAIQAARHQGVPIEGYILWTMSDNWEWSDGYCPKFGIVGVDRESDSL